MRALLLIFLFALVACNFEHEVLKFASCAFKSEKLRENIPKVIEAVKTGDFEKILSVGLASFSEVKRDIFECVNNEPELLDKPCKNTLMAMACYNTCPIFGRAKCVMECTKKYC